MSLTEAEQETVATYEQTAALRAKTDLSSNFWAKELEVLKKLLPPGKIIEIGSGAGRDAKELIAAGYDYTGTDITDAFLRIARENVPGGMFEKCSMYDLMMMFPRNHFDAIWSAATLLHSAKQQVGEALDAIHTVLRPGGIVFISLKEGSHEGMEPSPQNPSLRRFFAYWEIREFENVLNWHGFKVLRAHKKMAGEITWLCFFAQKLDIETFRGDSFTAPTLIAYARDVIDALELILSFQDRVRVIFEPLTYPVVRTAVQEYLKQRGCSASFIAANVGPNGPRFWINIEPVSG